MSKEKKRGRICFNWRILILFSLLIGISYSNSFSVPFHFDDFPNISENSRLHIDNLYPGKIYEVAFENTVENRKVYRPVSNLSIAVNWFLGQSNVTGYHIFNISCHILTAFFLYLTCANLLKTPNLYRRYDEDTYFIAVLAACLWALNPIQTQAVTYIVQRMAAMAAMFYIMGIYCYLKARFCDSWTKRLLWSLGVGMSFLLALGSKENAIMFPISLLLVEMIFFQNMVNPEIRKKMLLAGSLVLVIVFATGIWLFLSSGFINSILSGYERRTFTFAERVLTQPRIVIFYLSQIFYPIADRLSIDHDIIVSTGLFSPWTTLPAIFLILLLIGTAVWQINKRPLISFAILFFFVNHIIESSIISLELIFEHRNYLPSMFLFFPVAAALKQVINYYMKKREKIVMRMVMICFVTTLIIMLGLGTYIRNMAWMNDKILWEDTIEKAPGRARAYHNLASGYYTRIRDYDKIMELSKTAMYLDDSTRYKAEIISLNNIAHVYAEQKNDYEKVIQLYNRILNIQPNHTKTRYRLVLALIKTGQIKEAMEHIDQLLHIKPTSIQYLNIKSFILLKNGEPEEALHYLKKAVKIDPDDEMVMLNMGVAKKMVGNFISAEHYFKRIKSRSVKRMTALFFLIENSFQADNSQNAEKYAKMIVSEFSSTQILNSLEQVEEPGFRWPISVNLIAPVIAKEMSKQSTNILEYRKGDDG